MKRKREVNYCFVWGFDFFLSVCLTTLLLFFYFSFSEISKSLHRETQRRKEMMNSWIMNGLFSCRWEREMAVEIQRRRGRERESLLEFKRLKSDPLVTMAPAILAFFLFFWLLRWIFFFLNTVLEFSFSFSFSFFTLSAKQSLLYGFIF